ncbi:2-aminoethylphosphonate aminotransferase [Helicobacter sp. 23-1044]
MKIERKILLNPGPATTSDSVKMAQVVSDICPREKEFGEVMEFISEKLTDFVANNKDYTSVLFGGSGSAGVEAVLSSICDNKKILVINNGSYSERMAQILRTYTADFTEFKSDIIAPIDFDRLDSALKNTKFDYICAVHNETGTGLLNDINRIGALSKTYGAKFVVDAMSSYAGIPIDMGKSNIDFLIASSNKNIQGIAGVVFVICKKDSLENLKDTKAKSLYLDLYAQYKYFATTKQMRFTPPVQTLYALKQAIIETLEEGIDNRHKRYTESWAELIKGCEKLNLKLLLDIECQSKIITAIYEPKCTKYSFDSMHDYLYERNFTIYPGKVSSFDTFRVANIGAIDKNDIADFLKVLERYLRDIGYL